MAPTTKRANRKPRYLVNPLSGMRVRIDKSLNRHHALATIGEGGFGIYCSHKESRLIRMTTIEIELEVGEHCVKTQGRVQYFKCLPQIRPDLYFVGISLAHNPEHAALWKVLMEEARYKGYLAKPIH